MKLYYANARYDNENRHILCAELPQLCLNTIWRPVPRRPDLITIATQAQLRHFSVGKRCHRDRLVWTPPSDCRLHFGIRYLSSPSFKPLPGPPDPLCDGRISEVQEYFLVLQHTDIGALYWPPLPNGSSCGDLCIGDGCPSFVDVGKKLGIKAAMEVLCAFLQSSEWNGDLAFPSTQASSLFRFDAKTKKWKPPRRKWFHFCNDAKRWISDDLIYKALSLTEDHSL